MLSRSVPCNHSDQREHLIIELKAPKVKINQDEIVQIESYAFAVAQDERFRNLKTRWEFWVLSNDYGNYAIYRLKQNNYSNGIIYQSEPNSGIGITIRVKAWSELIQECKHRLNFIKEQLNFNIDKNTGLEYLREKYSKYLQEVHIADADDNEESDEEAATEKELVS
jgi:hypothetical protein